MFIVHRKVMSDSTAMSVCLSVDECLCVWFMFQGISLDGTHPTLLYGYGGFNVSLTPYFSTSRVILMQNFRGVFAIANLRGGG